MKTTTLFLSAILLAALAHPAAAQAPSLPEQLQTDAYVQLVQGDQSLDSGNLEDALAQYQAARRSYGQLAAEYPSWEPRIVRYRAAYCDNQIAEINRRIGERAATYTAQTAATAPAAYYGTPSAYDPPPAPYAPSSYDNPAPASGGVPESLYQTALRRADSLQAQLDSARNAEQQARAELARIRAEFDRANRTSSQADTELARLRELQGRQQNELQLLRAENERLKTQLAAKADLDGALNDAERALSDARAENQALQSQLEDLREDLEDAEDRIAQATALASSQPAPAAEPSEPSAPDTFDPSTFSWPDAAPAPAPTGFAASAPADAPSEPSASPSEPPIAPVIATFPPRPIPPGVDPADFIRLLLSNNENETAFATVQKARADAPDDPALATLEGIALIRLHHYAAAADLLHKLSIDHPDDATIHANLGAAWIGDGFYAGARAALQNAIDLNPDIGGEYYYNLALVCALTEPRDLETARSAYLKALDAGVPRDPQLDTLLP